MQGGIFQSCCSFTVTFLVGECMTGAGGDGGPLGTLELILNLRERKSSIKSSQVKDLAKLLVHLGGDIGSFCASTKRMTRCFAPELNAAPCCDGVYLYEMRRDMFLP